MQASCVAATAAYRTDDDGGYSLAAGRRTWLEIWRAMHQCPTAFRRPRVSKNAGTERVGRRVMLPVRRRCADCSRDRCIQRAAVAAAGGGRLAQ